MCPIRFRKTLENQAEKVIFFATGISIIKIPNIPLVMEVQVHYKTRCEPKEQEVYIYLSAYLYRSEEPVLSCVISSD